MDPIYTLPTIHINGTGAENLRYEYFEALKALKNLRQAIIDTTCHERDFYPQSHEAYIDARYERAEMFAKLADIENHLSAWYEHASNHIKE